MIYNDTSQWHWIHDATAYHQACDTIMLRSCWRDDASMFRVDSRFAQGRHFHDIDAVGHYQRVGRRSLPGMASRLLRRHHRPPAGQRVADDRH
jgi:hypothetical protein